MKNFPLASLAASLVGAAILGILCLRYKSARSEPGAIFLWAGAIGNLADRLIYGYVIDWFYIGVYVNLADVWLCAGCLVILRRAAGMFRGHAR
jgi:signal peptidase II